MHFAFFKTVLLSLDQMNWPLSPNILVVTNLILLLCLFTYLASKIRRHPSVAFLEISLVPVILFTFGHNLFNQVTDSAGGATLIVLGIVLTPVTFVPLSHHLGRDLAARQRRFWIAFYALQAVLLVFLTRAIFTGRMVEWVTGILEQPIIIIAQEWRYYFLNVIGSNVIALLYLDTTLQHAGESSREKLKFMFVAYLGFTAYFSYLSAQVVLWSYIPQSTLHAGAAVISCALAILGYSFFRYPVWEVKLGVSRNLVFGVLSSTAGIFYLIISGSILDLLRWASPQGTPVLVPFVTFVLVALLLVLYLSPSFRNNIQNFLATNVFRNKYDYRDLWMRFSDNSSESLNIREVLPRLAKLIADTMFVRQVAIWLRSPTSGTFHLAYCHDAASPVQSDVSILRLDYRCGSDEEKSLFKVPRHGDKMTTNKFPIDKAPQLALLGIDRVALVEKDHNALALLGIGGELRGEKSSAEDERLLTSIGNQLGNLILTHKLSEELLLSREWDSFNRFASFILHDLKNLATLQGMTLENAKHLSHNPEFTADAFATFHQTTDKMINLIASLSIQRGQFSLKQQPVNILEILSNTFDDLKINQRNRVKVVTTFPPVNKPPIISGDPELLQKAFTNLLLNAIQSLPQGEGAVEVSVSEGHAGKITAAIRDTGCGIPPERLRNLFRPFQTTKEKGMGIGLCHTRSIIEVHGGQIRIESEVNAGTKVEIDLPTV
jgi:putative PEP-CTERM system histidine kinase